MVVVGLLTNGKKVSQQDDPAERVWGDPTSHTGSRGSERPGKGGQTVCSTPPDQRRHVGLVCRLPAQRSLRGSFHVEAGLLLSTPPPTPSFANVKSSRIGHPPLFFYSLCRTD